MMLIPCPHCGDRAQTEFSYGGDATIKRPDDANSMPIEDWLDYVYLRDNPRGPHSEWWHHTGGCRRWIQVRRNTQTHEILGSATADEKLAGSDAKGGSQ